MRADTPSGALRVGLAHGSVAGRLPEAADAANPIDRRARGSARGSTIWRWATGTARSRSRPRTWYAGTPEPDRFRANDAGNVLLVELDGPGAPPTVTRLPTARHAWRQLEPRPHRGRRSQGGAGPTARRGCAGLERAVVQLTLTGVLDLEARAALEAALGRWAGELCHLEVRDELMAEPSERDLLSLGESPVIGAVARELAALAAGDAGQRDGGVPGPAPALSRASAPGSGRDEAAADRDRAVPQARRARWCWTGWATG